MNPYRGINQSPARSFNDISPEILEKFGLSYQGFETKREVDELLEYYRYRVRISPKRQKDFWEELQTEWQRRFPDIVLPNRVFHTEYSLHFNQQCECLVENYCEHTNERNDLSIASDTSFLATLYRFAPKDFSKKELPKRRLLSCYEIDELIKLAGNQTLAAMAIDPHTFKIINIPHEMYVLMAKERQWGKWHWGTVTNQSLYEGIQTFLAGGYELGPASTHTVCYFPSNIRHTCYYCSLDHTPGLIRLAVVLR